MYEQWLHIQLDVNGSPARLAPLVQQKAALLLRSGMGAEPTPEQAFPVEVQGGEEMTTAFIPLRVTTSPVEEQASCVRLPLRWEPEREGSFSTFRGALEFEPHEERGGQLTLFGRYALPDGGGSAATVMAVTRATARRLLRAFATELARAAAGDVEPAAPAPPATLHVRDVMTPDPITVREDTPILTATLVLLRHQIAGVPVLDDEGRAVGVLSESDLLARAAAPRQRRGATARMEEQKRQAVSAGEACSRPPVTIGAGASLQEAARVLLDRDISRVLVVEGGSLAGVLSRHDALKALARSRAQLQAYVDARLDEEGIPGVHAEVLASGSVRLSGRVRYRNSLPTLEHAVRSIDGVLDVVDDLAWFEDDTVIST